MVKNCFSFQSRIQWCTIIPSSQASHFVFISMYEDVLKNVKFLEVLMGRLLSITTFSESLGISMTFPEKKSQL